MLQGTPVEEGTVKKLGPKTEGLGEVVDETSGAEGATQERSRRRRMEIENGMAIKWPIVAGLRQSLREARHATRAVRDLAPACGLLAHTPRQHVAKPPPPLKRAT